MRGRVNAIRTFKGLVTDLRFKTDIFTKKNTLQTASVKLVTHSIER